VESVVSRMRVQAEQLAVQPQQPSQPVIEG
jgi:hypothetical protein